MGSKIEFLKKYFELKHSSKIMARILVHILKPYIETLPEENLTDYINLISI